MSDAAKAIQAENAFIERNVNAWLFRLDIMLNNT